MGLGSALKLGGKILAGTGVTAAVGGVPLALNFPGLVGQDAESVLTKDGSTYNPKTKKVKRKAGEELFDKIFGREPAILEAGKANRVTKLENDFKELLKARPGTTITADSDVNELRNLQKNVEDIDAAIRIYQTSGGPLSKIQLEKIGDAGRIRTMAEEAYNDRAIRRAEAEARAAFKNPQAEYERDRQTKADLLALDLQALQREELQGQRRLDNRRQDLKEYEVRLSNARADREAQQLALMTIIQGLANVANNVV